MDVLDFVGDTTSAADATAEQFLAFAGWSTAERRAVARLGVVETFAAGTEVIAAGAVDRSLLIVVDGHFDIVRGRHADRVGPGDIVGELAFVDGLPRSASVRTAGPAKALRVRPDDVQRLAKDEPEFALKFVWEVARILANRLRKAWR